VRDEKGKIGMESNRGYLRILRNNVLPSVISAIFVGVAFSLFEYRDAIRDNTNSIEAHKDQLKIITIKEDKLKDRLQRLEFDLNIVKRDILECKKDIKEGLK
jgi:septal ring factor EnvC (AmiA/AmiB activator)